MFRRLTLAVGFGAGYVLGAKAGRQRYEQIRTNLSQLRSHPAAQQFSGTDPAATTTAADNITSTGHDIAGAAPDTQPMTSPTDVTTGSHPGSGGGSARPGLGSPPVPPPPSSIDEMSELELDLATRPTPPAGAAGPGAGSRPRRP